MTGSPKGNASSDCAISSSLMPWDSGRGERSKVVLCLWFVCMKADEYPRSLYAMLFLPQSFSALKIGLRIVTASHHAPTVAVHANLLCGDYHINRHRCSDICASGLRACTAIHWTAGKAGTPPHPSPFACSGRVAEKSCLSGTAMRRASTFWWWGGRGIFMCTCCRSQSIPLLLPTDIGERHLGPDISVRNQP